MTTNQRGYYSDPEVFDRLICDARNVLAAIRLKTSGKKAPVQTTLQEVALAGLALVVGDLEAAFGVSRDELKTDGGAKA